MTGATARSGMAVALVSGDGATLGVGLGVALVSEGAVALGEGETVATGGGEAVALGKIDGDALGDGEGVEAGLSFFFVVDLLRCFGGVGVGRTKRCLIFSPSDSSSSSVPRAWLATAITTVIAITINERSFIFIRCFLYVRAASSCRTA